MTGQPDAGRRRSAPIRYIVVAGTAIVLVSLVPIVALATHGGVHVDLQDGTSGCNGVLPTPGSENTTKRVIGGTLDPGGTAIFQISYPVSASEVGSTFTIIDCAYIAGDAWLKYQITFVPNNTNFILEFALDIPADAPYGAEYCNYAKTTGTPSNSQASNRKSGPACFIIGSAIRIHKTDADGLPLAGATFDITCNYPVVAPGTFLADTIVNVAGTTYRLPSSSGGMHNFDATTGTDGVIAIQAPELTTCTFIETSPPAGYLPPPETATTLTVRHGEAGSHTFVNTFIVVPTAVPTPTPPASASVSPAAPASPATTSPGSPSLAATATASPVASPVPSPVASAILSPVASPLASTGSTVVPSSSAASSPSAASPSPATESAASQSASPSSVATTSPTVAAVASVPASPIVSASLTPATGAATGSPAALASPAGSALVSAAASAAATLSPASSGPADPDASAAASPAGGPRDSPTASGGSESQPALPSASDPRSSGSPAASPAMSPPASAGVESPPSVPGGGPEPGAPKTNADPRPALILAPIALALLSMSALSFVSVIGGRRST